LKENDIFKTALLSVQQIVKILAEKKLTSIKNFDVAQVVENLYLQLLRILNKLLEKNIESDARSALFSTITQLNSERQKLKDTVSPESWQILQANNSYYTNIVDKYTNYN